MCAFTLVHYILYIRRLEPESRSVAVFFQPRIGRRSIEPPKVQSGLSQTPSSHKNCRFILCSVFAAN